MGMVPSAIQLLVTCCCLSNRQPETLKFLPFCCAGRGGVRKSRTSGQGLEGIILSCLFQLLVAPLGCVTQPARCLSPSSLLSLPVGFSVRCPPSFLTNTSPSAIPAPQDCSNPGFPRTSIVTLQKCQCFGNEAPFSSVSPVL